MAGDLKHEKFRPRSNKGTVRHALNGRRVFYVTAVCVLLVFVYVFSSSGGMSDLSAKGNSFIHPPKKAPPSREPKAASGVDRQTHAMVHELKKQAAGEEAGSSLKQLDEEKKRVHDTPAGAPGPGDARTPKTQHRGKSRVEELASDREAARQKQRLDSGKAAKPGTQKAGGKPASPAELAAAAVAGGKAGSPADGPGKQVTPPSPTRMPNKDGAPQDITAAGKDDSNDAKLVETSDKAIRGGSAAANAGAIAAAGKNGGKQPKEGSSTADDAAFDAKGHLKSLLKQYDVVLFSKTFCPHSARAKRILELYDVSPRPVVYELDRESHGSQTQEALEALTGRRTVPNLIVKGQSLGGGDEVAQLDADDTLVAAVRKLAPRVDISRKTKA
ncbi:hypothetical protein PYCC9005_002908 [Savitreella phatthalungensis]